MSPKLVVGQVCRKVVYHTDPECAILRNSDNEPQEATPSEIEFHDLTECPRCSGEKGNGEDAEERRSPLTSEGHDPGPLDPDAIAAAREQAREIADSFESDPFGDVINA